MPKRYTQVMLIIALFLMGGAPPTWASVELLADGSTSHQEAPTDFFIQAAGMVTTDNALRYTVYVPKPLTDAKPYVIQVEVSPNAIINQVLHGGQSTFAGILAESTEQGQTLVWTIEPSALSDSTTLSFILAQPIDKPLVVTVTGGGGSVQKPIIPRYTYHFSNVGQVTLDADSAAEFQRVGVTGILIRAASGVVGGQATPITARALLLEDNPPAEIGDYWWCSVLELTEIATGERVVVQMPLRRPLPPGTPVVLFQRQADGSWVPLENPGVVTADGQAVEYEHPGGVIATGVEASLQPQFAVLTVLTRQAFDALLPPVGEISAVSPVQRFADLPPDIQTAFAAAQTTAEFSAASPENGYSARCSPTTNGDSVCAYWVEVGLCTISVNALPNVEAVPNVTCSNTPPPEGYNSACQMGDEAC